MRATTADHDTATADHDTAMTGENTVTEWEDSAAGWDPRRRAGGPRARRRRSGWTILLAIVVVPGAIAVVGDRVAADYAAGELRAQLVAELADRGIEFRTTDVSIGGFPFLTQVAEGTYDEITIDMADVTLPMDGGQPVTLPALNVIAQGVDANTADVVAGTAKITAERVSGTAVVSFATLATLVDLSQYSLSDVRFAESSGAVRVTGTATVAGVAIPISATADIVVADGQFQVRLRDAEALSVPVPGAAQRYVAGLVERSVTARLPELPFNLALDHISVDPAGLAIGATGRDVPLVT